MKRRFKIAFLATLVVVGSAWIARNQLDALVPSGDTTRQDRIGEDRQFESTIGADAKQTTKSRGVDFDAGAIASKNSEIPSYMRADRSGYTVNIFDKDVEFPGGQYVTVRFRPGESDAQLSPELDNQRDAGFFERLSPEAEQGNGYAAYRLYKSLVECRGAPRDETEYSDYLNQLDQTFTYPDRSTELGTKSLDVDENIVQQKSRMKTKYERCIGVTSEMTNAAHEYLKIAADASISSATLDYARSVQPTEPEVAVKYYDKAWQLGDAGGAYELGRMYRDSKVDSVSDPVTGYAYLYVAHAVSFALFEGLKGQVYDSIRESQENRFEQEIRSIRPSEIELALPVAMELLRDNQNCCVY